MDRTDNKAAREALAPALASLASGTSLVIAPEGTRSPTPRLLPFKKGAFHLAMQAGVPMIPVVIRNAGEIMAAHSMILTPGTVQVRVLEPVSTADWTADNLDEQVARWSRCTPTRSTTGKDARLTSEPSSLARGRVSLAAEGRAHRVVNDGRSSASPSSCAERSGEAGGHQWRTNIEDNYEGAVIAAAAIKPSNGIGAAPGVDFVVLCDGDGAWGAGRIVRTFRVNQSGREVHRALVDPTDVHEDVIDLIERK